MAGFGMVKPHKIKLSRKIRLRRIRLNSQGYDSRGRYWGTGAPLYEAEHDDDGSTIIFRARDKETAKEKVTQAIERSNRYSNIKRETGKKYHQLVSE